MLHDQEIGTFYLLIFHLFSILLCSKKNNHLPPPSKANENIISKLKGKTERYTAKSEIFNFKSVLDFIAKSIKHNSVFILKRKDGTTIFNFTVFVIKYNDGETGYQLESGYECRIKKQVNFETKGDDYVDSSGNPFISSTTINSIVDYCNQYSSEEGSTLSMGGKFFVSNGSSYGETEHNTTNLSQY